jgi:hypothetical protein
MTSHKVPPAGFSDAMEPKAATAGHGGKPVCGGKLKQARADGRTTCTQPAGWDTPHPGIGCCSRHGGATPNHIKSAQTEQARQLLGTLGIVEDPSNLPPVVVHVELQLSAAKHLAAVRWLEQQVATVPADQVPDSPWTKLLAEHRRECDRLLVELQRLGVELAAIQFKERLDQAYGQEVQLLINALVTRLAVFWRISEAKGEREPIELDLMADDLHAVIQDALSVLFEPSARAIEGQVAS